MAGVHESSRRSAIEPYGATENTQVVKLEDDLRVADGYLIEVGQSTGLLVGRQAEIRPEDLPADG